MHQRSATENVGHPRRPAAFRFMFAFSGRKLSRYVVRVLGALCVCTMALAAEPPAERTLRVSHVLEPRQAPDEAERALLRLEARVGRTLNDDRAVISDLLARINRMTAVVADIHTLLTDMPAGQPCKPVSAPCPAAPAAPDTPAAAPGAGFGDMGALPWPAIVAGAAVAMLLWLWSRRRRQRPESGLGEVGVGPVQNGATPTKPPPAQKPVANAVPPARLLQADGHPEAVVRKMTAAAGPVQMVSIRPRAAQPPAAAALKPAGESDMSLELADVMLSMGLNDGAAQTLSEHIRNNPRQALFHWLKLLEVYKHSGRKAEFEKAAAELQHHFNMAPPEWLATEQAAGAKVEKLEDYPHIASRIQELWPHRTCAEYLHRLLEDTRGGTRAGFPQPVVEEILLLLSLLKD